MARWGVVLFVLIGALSGSVSPLIAQEAPPSAAVGGGSTGVTTTAVMRVGTQAIGVCGEPGYHAPYGNGLGLLEPGKQYYWTLNADFIDSGFHPLAIGRFVQVRLCGDASVPVAQVPEIGTAGACDSPSVSGGRGSFNAFGIAPGLVVFAVDDVSSTPTGSVVVVSGRVLGAEGEEPGTLRMVLQRRTVGMCAHKNHEATRIGTTYPQGGASAELVGVIAYQLPRARVANTVCADQWGQVRRHLRGAGAGLACPVPAEF